MKKSQFANVKHFVLGEFLVLGLSQEKVHPSALFLAMNS